MTSVRLLLIRPSVSAFYPSCSENRACHKRGLNKKSALLESLSLSQNGTQQKMGLSKTHPSYLLLSRSLHLLVASCMGKPTQDKGFKVHNGEGPYSHPDLLSPNSLGALPLPHRNPHFLPKKDLHDLLWDNSCL